MKKFLVLYSSTATAQEQMARTTPEMAKAGIEVWMAWARKAGSAVVDLGMPLGNPLAVTPTAVGAGTSKVAGYSILQAESAAAVRVGPSQKRKFVPGPAGVTLLALGGTPGKAYEPRR